MLPSHVILPLKIMSFPKEYNPDEPLLFLWAYYLFTLCISLVSLQPYDSVDLFHKAPLLLYIYKMFWAFTHSFQKVVGSAIVSLQPYDSVDLFHKAPLLLHIYKMFWAFIHSFQKVVGRAII